VIVSLAIVAGGVAIAFGAIGFMENIATHDRHRLNGTEIAHRVILQYIDDFKSLRSQVHRVPMGGSMYQFEITENVLLTESGDGVARSGGKASQRRKSVSAKNASVEERFAAQIHQITVDVYLEHPDGTRSARPVATLVRSYNPVMGLGTRGMTYWIEMLNESQGQRVIE